ncbi:hypothetical protein TrCOL_g11263 [Triparma columacea]|uniref:Uncharacterized protein n=1 Tax=Triparma columacea TaxID=722753 RepID=A0A9W7L6E6_9STRA|nr:hypothetical protein TrCOL_g11263 [Triparma columacea]
MLRKNIQSKESHTKPRTNGRWLKAQPLAQVEEQTYLSRRGKENAKKHRAGTILAVPTDAAIEIMTRTYSSKEARIENCECGELLGIQTLSPASIMTKSSLYAMELPRIMANPSFATWTEASNNNGWLGVGFNPDFTERWLTNPTSVEMVRDVVDTHLLVAGIEGPAAKHGYPTLDCLGAAAYGNIDRRDFKTFQTSYQPTQQIDRNLLGTWRGARRELLEEAGVLIPFSWIFDHAIVKHFTDTEAPRPYYLRDLSRGSNRPPTDVTQFTIVVPEGYVCVEKTSATMVMHPEDEDKELIHLNRQRRSKIYISLEKPFAGLINNDMREIASDGNLAGNFNLGGPPGGPPPTTTTPPGDSVAASLRVAVDLHLKDGRHGRELVEREDAVDAANDLAAYDAAYRA